MTTVGWSAPRRATAGRLLAAAVLCLTALLAAPIAAATAATRVDHLAGVAIVMPRDPVLRDLRPGGLVTVKVKPSAQARRHHRVAVITLVRLSHEGELTDEVIARRTLAAGTFAAQVPPARGGTYRLHVRVGRSFVEATFDVAFDEPALPGSCGGLPSDVSAELGVDPSNPRPGAMVNLTLANTGPGCLTTGYGFVWQVSRGGAWVDVPLNLVVPTVFVSLQPGSALQDTFTVPANTAPGLYRIVKHFHAAGEDDEIAVDVQVVARRHA